MRITRFVLITVAVGLALVTTAPAPAKPSANGHRGVTVMTRNLYLGADLDPILLAQTPEQLVLAVTQAWSDVQATDFNANTMNCNKCGAHDGKRQSLIVHVGLCRGYGKAQCPLCMRDDFTTIADAYKCYVSCWVSAEFCVHMLS